MMGDSHNPTSTHAQPMRHTHQLFEFVLLTTQHFTLLHRWLNEPHVAQWWDGPQSRAEVDHKFLANIGTHWIDSSIVCFSDTPIGFLQSYRAHEVGGGWWPEADAGVLGMDQFIGDVEYLHKGYGSAFIRQYVAKIFASDLSVHECIADPDPTNIAAIKAYEKAGFLRDGPVSTPDGPALLMRLRRDHS